MITDLISAYHKGAGSIRSISSSDSSSLSALRSASSRVRASSCSKSQPIMAFFICKPLTAAASFARTSSLQTVASNQIVIRRCAQRGDDSLSIGKRPHAEIVDPNLAVDVIHVVVIENVLELEQTPHHHPFSASQESGDIGATFLSQRE